MTDRSHDTASEHARHGDRVEREQREHRSTPHEGASHHWPEKSEELQVRDVKAGDTVVLGPDNEPFVEAFASDPDFRTRWSAAGEPRQLKLIARGEARIEGHAAESLVVELGGQPNEVALPAEAAIRVLRA